MNPSQDLCNRAGFVGTSGKKSVHGRHPRVPQRSPTIQMTEVHRTPDEAEVEGLVYFGLLAVVDRALGVRPISKDERPAVSAVLSDDRLKRRADGHQTTGIANDRFRIAASAGCRCVAVDLSPTR
jgi:hypothetical protein